MKSDTGRPAVGFQRKRRPPGGLFRPDPASAHPVAPGLGRGGGCRTGVVRRRLGPCSAAIAVGGIGIGMANSGLRFFGKGDEYMQDHYAQLHEEFEKLKQQKSAELADDLKKLGCKQGQTQVAQFEDKFQNLLAVFRRVLSENELTFSRVMGTAEQVYPLGPGQPGTRGHVAAQRQGYGSGGHHGAHGRVGAKAQTDTRR